ncbi:MAG: hypothetical protein AAF721_21365, partial [Myxococcota bacterium]
MRPSISLFALLLACKSAEPASDPVPGAVEETPEPALNNSGERESEPAPAKDSEEVADPEPEAAKEAAKEDGGEPSPAALPEVSDSAPGPREAAVETKVALGDGTVLRVGAEDGDPKSTLFVEATAVAADPSSPPAPHVQDLRKTTGNVVALQAAHDGKTLWVAWRTSVPGKDGKPDRALVAVA